MKHARRFCQEIKAETRVEVNQLKVKLMSKTKPRCCLAMPVQGLARAGLAGVAAEACLWHPAISGPFQPLFKNAAGIMVGLKARLRVYPIAPQNWL